MSWGDVMDNQAELVDGLVGGERRAFEELITLYGRRLLAKAEQMLGNREDARDCVQECYMQVHRKIGSFRNEAKLYSWVHRILINTCLSKIRSAPRTLLESLEDCEATKGGDCNWAEALWQEFAEADQIIENIHLKNTVMNAVQQLPETYQQVLSLRDVQGYSTAEAACIMSISEASTKVRLHRARGMLRQTLQPHFGDN